MHPCVFIGYMLVKCKNQRVQIQLDSKLDFNWSPIVRHMSINFFLIFMANELLGIETEKSKSN